MRGSIEARARQVLADLSVTPDAPAASLQGKTSTGKPETKAPPWPGVSAYDYHRRHITRSWDSTRKLEEAVEAAEEELHDIRYAKRRVDTNTHEGKFEIALAAGTAARVARVYGVTVRHVYAMREWARRHGVQA